MHASTRTITATALGVITTGATVTTGPTGRGALTGLGAPIDLTGHGAPTGRIGRIAPTGRIGRTGLTDQTGRADQIVRIGQTDPTGRTVQNAPIAVDQQSIVRQRRTYSPTARTALAAWRRRRRPIAWSRADRAGIRDGGWRTCGLYSSGQNLLSDSYPASDYLV